MDITYLINLTIIGICMVFCVYNGFKSKIFKVLLLVYACLLVVCIESKFNKLMLSDINVENVLIERSLSEKISSTFVDLMGTIILIISLNVMLKQIFKVVDGRLEKSLCREIMDRIRGALDGVFLLYQIGGISVDTYMKLPCRTTVCNLPDKFITHKNTDIYKLVRNLN